MEEEETGTNILQKRVKRLMAVALMLTVILVTIGLLYYQTYNQYNQIQTEFNTTQTELQGLQNTFSSTAKYVATGNISVTFTAYQPVQQVSGSEITYLMGVLTVTNLTKIVASPITLIASFHPNVTYPQQGNVTYSYTPSQTLQIPPHLNLAEIPWGAFPITLQNFVSGNVINWNMTIIVSVLWMGSQVTSAQVETNFKLDVI
jgi:archaellum component FlaF (FlaF/FlaG flagellin family)